MTRKEFVELIGGTTAIFCIGCNKAEFLATPVSQDRIVPDNGQPLVGANSDTGKAIRGPLPDPPPKLDFTIDLDEPAHQQLKFAGGFIQLNNVIIALTLNHEYIAAQLKCTHNGVEIEFSGANDRFECPAHGSKFDKNGQVITGPALLPIKIYKTQATGTMLRVYEV